MKHTLLFLFCLLFILPSHTLMAQAQQLEITQIAPNVYVHTSYKMFGEVRFPSHGMLVSTNEGVVMIDTGWGSEPTQQLLHWVAEHLKQPVKACVVTHFHDDRLGGADVLRKARVPVIGSKLTINLASKNGLPVPSMAFKTDTTFTIGKQRFEVYFPGAGHTLDNLVVYLPHQRILFGGCLVKDVQAKSLGNIADANLTGWPDAIRRVQQRFLKAKTIVPSHGPWGDKTALDHTLQLLEQATKKQP